MDSSCLGDGLGVLFEGMLLFGHFLVLEVGLWLLLYVVLVVVLVLIARFNRAFCSIALPHETSFFVQARLSASRKPWKGAIISRSLGLILR